MPRRKKNATKPPSAPVETLTAPSGTDPSANPPTPPSASPKSAEGSASESSEVRVEIESHVEPKAEGLFTRFLRRSSEPEGAKETGSEPEAPSGKRGYTRRSDSDQIANLTISIVTLAIAGLNLPEDVKPNEEEIDSFSGFGTSILLRHFPMRSKLSRDALDIIGMISIMAMWYRRVAPMIRIHRAEAQAQREGPPSEAVTPTIERADPLTQQLFRRSHGSADTAGAAA